MIRPTESSKDAGRESSDTGTLRKSVAALDPVNVTSKANRTRVEFGAQAIPFQQNQRDEVRDLGDVVGALSSQPGMKQQNYLAMGVATEPPTEASSSQLTLFAVDSHARTYRWLGSVLDWLEAGADYGSSSIASLLRSVPLGWSSRTCPAFSAATEAQTWPWFSEGWQNSGIGGPTGCLTLNTLESPKDAVGCSLSDILESGPIPPKYFLSPRAASGIIRRAAQRGKELPAPLQAALLQVAQATESEAGVIEPQ